jgi:exo-1,4-beta-D-glucosaminidase
MNLNAIRLEGQLQPDYFFDLADEYGILIMAGWCCCSHWEHWQHREDYKEGPVWDREDYEIAAASQADQIRRLRNHPSMLVWLNGSDNPPPADVEQMYVNILKKYQWPNPFLSSATAKKAELTGASGVKMEGPYEWVPPSYWLLDKQAGGAQGFATEISPGPAVPPLESLERMLPKDHLWPIDDYWNYHAGGGQFKNIKVFTEALNKRYGTATNARDYAAKSQLMTYEAQRAMFEAYAGRRYASTGVIQWMLNNAWPSLIWHLYDYYLVPGGGYFGTKKACEPVHVQYSYDDKSVIVVNTTKQPLRNLKVTARLFDLNLVEKFSRTTEVDLSADSNVKAFSIPQVTDLSTTYFLKLTLDAAGQLVSSNFYWLSTADDVLDPQRTKWYYTPVSSYADMTGLGKLPTVSLKVSGTSVRRGGEEIARVNLANPSHSLAFFVHLQMKRGDTPDDVVPVFWEDNYFSLLPGEQRQITATYAVKNLENLRAFLVAEAWNSSPIRVQLTGTH